jgi:tetratricopeptide (TPR) repeat protein
MSRRSNRELPGDIGSPTRSGPLAGQGHNPFGPEVQRHNRWLSLAVCLLLALAVWAVFGQTRHYEFVNFDDNLYVYENPIVERGLTLNGIGWALTYGQIGHWHPVTWLSHMLDCQLYGLHPGGHHLTNVLLHAATAILLFLVLRKMTGALGRSAFVAAVFAVHPLRVESVAWVAERKDVLGGLFFMLTLWAYARHVEHITSARWQRTGTETATSTTDSSPVTCHLSPAYWLVLLFFILGLLSKSMLVTLPFVLLLLDYWPLQRLRLDGRNDGRSNPQPWRAKVWQLVVEKIPLIALAAASCAVTGLAPEQVAFSERVPFSLRLENVFMAYVTYLWQMVYPARLANLDLYPANGTSLGEVLMALALLVVISIVAVAGWRKRPYFAVGWFWYLGMLVPVIGLVQVGAQAHADRYTYLPQIGLYILVAWGVWELCGAWRYRQAVLGFAAAAILAGLLAGAYVQTGYWEDNVSLWTHTLACTPENYLAHNNLGVALAAQGKWDEAFQHYERALQLKPDYPEAYCNLGVALAAQGKLDEAIQHYERALQLEPDYPEAHCNLGDMLATQGKWAQAIQHYERALQLDPEDPKNHCNLGIALATQGKLAEAILQFQQALTLATAQGNTALAESIRTRLESYQRALLQPQTP